MIGLYDSQYKRDTHDTAFIRRVMNAIAEHKTIKAAVIAKALGMSLYTFRQHLTDIKAYTELPFSI